MAVPAGSWRVPGPGQGGIHWLTSSMPEEGFPWWSRRLGAGAGCCPAGLLGLIPCVPLRAAGRGGCLSPVMATLCGSWGGWSQLCRAGAHPWGADTTSTPGASWHSSPCRLPAAGTNGDELPPGSMGQGNKSVGRWKGGGLSPLPFSGAAPSLHPDCHARGGWGALTARI